MQKKGHRKQRRSRISDDMSMYQFETLVGSTQPGLRIPTMINELPRAILNAISTILPRRAHIRIFGYTFTIFLVGVVYRHRKITWIIFNPVNNTRYLSCHFLADAIHLFECLRYQMHSVPQKKYNRQSFNAATVIYRTFHDFTNHTNKHQLTSIGTSVLQLNSSEYDIHRMYLFLQKADHENNILEFQKYPVPSIVGGVMDTSQILQDCKGWKNFAPTVNNSGVCMGGKRRNCTCSSVINTILSTPNWGPDTIIRHVPTTLSS